LERGLEGTLVDLGWQAMVLVEAVVLSFSLKSGICCNGLNPSGYSLPLYITEQAEEVAPQTL